METILTLLASNPAAWAFGLLLACGLGLPPWSEEVVVLGSGYFIAEGDLTYMEALTACVAGILVGDSIIYALGRFAGERVYGWPILRRHMQPMKRHKFNRLFFKHGTKAVFAARFLPGFRMLAYFVAGNLHLKFWKFIVLDTIGIAISVPISIWLGWKLADNLEQATHILHQFQFPIAALAIAVVSYLFWRRRQKRLARLADLREQRLKRQGSQNSNSDGHQNRYSEGEIK